MTDQDHSNTPDTTADSPPPVTFLTVVSSTLKAAFGVADPAARERDFQHKSIAPFVAAGVIFTAVFVAVVALVVQAVLPA